MGGMGRGGVGERGWGGRCVIGDGTGSAESIQCWQTQPSFSLCAVWGIRCWGHLYVTLTGLPLPFTTLKRISRPQCEHFSIFVFWQRNTLYDVGIQLNESKGITVKTSSGLQHEFIDVDRTIAYGRLRIDSLFRWFLKELSSSVSRHFQPSMQVLVCCTCEEKSIFRRSMRSVITHFSRA